MPQGWLANQLQIQATGLSGHLDEFWPDIADSGWFGGQAEGWERAPYWLDGMVALAAALDDPILQDRVESRIAYIIEHQAPDGWIGPEQDTATGRYEARDPWPVIVALKALTQWYDWWGEKGVLAVIGRILHCLDRELDKRPLYSWGQMRWADLVLSIHWLYDITGEDWLLTMAEKVKAQGFDWQAHFLEFPFTEKTAPEDQSMLTHVVNNAMAIKAPAVWSRQSGSVLDQIGTQHAIAELDRYHGQVTGVFSGDEHLAGRNPSQGTELCAIVEYMFSLETAVSILGDPALADRLERIAFNALPAAFRFDMWAHQYDQQVNQIRCAKIEDPIYTSNGPDANIFGLEPNYGCCTANMHQGWPKFVQSLWMETPNEGLAAISYAPCRVTQVRNDDSVLTIWVDTDYPFEEHVTITVRAEEPITTTLYLRIPLWCHEATIQGEDWTRKNLTPGRFVPIQRTWEGDTVIDLNLPMPLVAEPRYNNSVALTLGPLVMAANLQHDWSVINGKPPVADWQVQPVQPWNIGIRLDRHYPEEWLEIGRQRLGMRPFQAAWPPVQLRAVGRVVPTWGEDHGAAAPPPRSPAKGQGDLIDIWLAPYGCTTLRITEFPTLLARRSAKRTPFEQARDAWTEAISQMVAAEEAGQEDRGDRKD
ncbi:MAG: beta-L-arabinofuranosidase domain-containing protein [Anaerolineales bacterium]